MLCRISHLDVAKGPTLQWAVTHLFLLSVAARRIRESQQDGLGFERQRGVSRVLLMLARSSVLTQDLDLLQTC